MLRALLAVWAAVGLAGALVGCGSGAVAEANRYADAVNGAQADFARTVRALSGRITASSTPGQDSSSLRAFGGEVERVVAELRAVRPPARVAPLHGRLVADLAGYGADVRRTTGSVRPGDDPREVVAAQRRLLAATNAITDRVNRTIDAINRRLGA